MKINVELGGGIELLFNKNKTLEINLEEKNNNNYVIQDVINHMAKIISDKPELFINKETGKM